MEVEYNGFAIEVRKDESQGGFNHIYYTVVRLDDGLFVIDDHTSADEPLSEMVTMLKKRVDRFIDSKGASEDMEEDYESC